MFLFRELFGAHLLGYLLIIIYINSLWMQENVTYPSSQMKVNFRYAKTPVKGEQVDNEIKWMPPPSDRSYLANISQGDSTQRHQEMHQQPAFMVDPISRRIGKGLFVTTSKKKFDKQSEEKEQPPKRQPSNQAKELELLRKEVQYLRKRLSQSENAERELQFEIQFIKENSQMSSLLLEQNIINYSHDMENIQKEKFNQEQKKLIQENWDLREKLRTENLKRGELQNHLEKVRSQNHSLSKVSKNVESELNIVGASQEERENERERKMEEEGKIQSHVEMVAVLTEKIGAQEKELVMLRQHSQKQQTSWKQAVEEVKKLNIALVEASSRQTGGVSDQQYNDLKAKTAQYQQDHKQIQEEIVKISMFISQFKYLSEKAVSHMETDISTINQFRIKAQELDQIKEILSQETRPISMPSLSKNQSMLEKQNVALREDIAEITEQRNKLKQYQQILLSQIEDLKKDRNAYLGLVQEKNNQNSSLLEQIRNLREEKSLIEKRENEEASQMREKLAQMTTWFNSMAQDDQHSEQISRSRCQSEPVQQRNEGKSSGESEKLRHELASLRRQNELQKMKGEEALRSLQSRYQLQISAKNKEHTRQATMYADQIGKLMGELKKLKGNSPVKGSVIVEEDNEESFDL